MESPELQSPPGASMQRLIDKKERYDMHGLGLLEGTQGRESIIVVGVMVGLLFAGIFVGILLVPSNTDLPEAGPFRHPKVKKSGVSTTRRVESSSHSTSPSTPQARLDVEDSITGQEVAEEQTTTAAERIEPNDEST